MPTCGECPIPRESCPKISEIQVIQRDDPECEPRKRWREALQYAESLNELYKILAEEKISLLEQNAAARKEIDDLLSVLRSNLRPVTKKDIIEMIAINWTLAKSIFKEINWTENDMLRFKEHIEGILAKFT